MNTIQKIMKKQKECRFGHTCTSDCQNTKDCPCQSEHCCALTENCEGCDEHYKKPMENRIIKFRAWNELNTRKEERMILPATLTAFGEVIMPNGEEWRIPVMQFTGLFDKNGKEIYENDIIKGEHLIGEWIAKVDMLATGIWFGGARFSEVKDIEIIGNIYESPSLITK